jgi:inosine-uridine nucleoside N-ribohydrolase
MIRRGLLVATLSVLPLGQIWAAERQLLPVSAHQAHGTTVNVIFDTDMYSDIDDMLALAMLHALQDRAEVKLLAVTVGTEAKWTAPYVDLVNTFYGHEDIPVGMVRGGVTAGIFNEKPLADQPYSPNGINYTQYLAQLENKDGSLVYPHKLIDGEKAEEAVHLLRRVLAAQPDGSVVMVQVGYCTNFARLLDSKPDQLSQLDGRALVKRKIKLLSTMAGNFATGKPEFNLRMDVPASQKVFSEWPTPIVASGFEVGLQMLFPQRSIDREFNYVDHHPIAETYRYTAPYYRKASKHPDAPHDHATFDLTAVLYGARPDEGFFSLSEPGKISVLSDGGSRFEAVEGGPHRYLILTDDQKARTLETMVMLTSQPPVHRAKH